MQSKATTVAAYLASLPADRRAAVEAVRKVILANLDPGFEEGMQYGMIGYYVPHSRYPNGYHCDPRQPLPFASLASQKNYMAVYLMGLYYDPMSARLLEDAYAKAGKKPDMGKCCIRFKALEDLPLDVIGGIVKATTAEGYIRFYETALNQSTGTGARKTVKKATKGGAKKVAKKVAKKTAKKVVKKAGKMATKKSAKAGAKRR